MRGLTPCSRSVALALAAVALAIAAVALAIAANSPADFTPPYSFDTGGKPSTAPTTHSTAPTTHFTSVSISTASSTDSTSASASTGRGFAPYRAVECYNRNHRNHRNHICSGDSSWRRRMETRDHTRLGSDQGDGVAVPVAIAVAILCSYQ